MASQTPEKSRRNLLIRIRPVLRWVIKLRSSPRAISGGLGLGTFIAFTPTVGVQLILAMLFATLLNLNRPAALVPVWITNPFTVAPIYTFCYWLGVKFVDGPPLSKVSDLFIDIGRTLGHLEFWNIKEQFFAILGIGWNILFPLWIGSIIIGLVCGLAAYLLSFKALSIFLTRRAEKRLLNNRKR